MAAKTVLVTGASSGIGAAIARALAGTGYVVYGAARRADRLADLTADGVRPLAIDVTDDQSSRDGVDRIIEETGRLDVLINNAGYGLYGSVEDVPLDGARDQFEVNVFGAARLTRLVLPHMRAQRSGRIVNITSIGGRTYAPLGAWYHGSKYALEALSDCLRIETRPFGVDVVVVEPGGVRTEWSDIAADHVEQISGTGPYALQAKAVSTSMRSAANTARTSQPSVIADTVVKAVSARRPRTRYVAGYGARPLLFLRRHTSDRTFDWVMSRAVGLPT